MKRLQSIGFLLSAIWLITLMFGCGGGTTPLPKKEEAMIAEADQSQLPPIPDPEEAIRLQEDILKQRQQNIARSVPYDRQAAVEYALKHWQLIRESEDFNHDGYLEPTPESLHDLTFRVFKDNCTAYISQCLWAGGVPMYGISDPLHKLDYWEPWSWWYDDWTDKRPDNGFGLDTRQSLSWINTDRFWWFMYFRVGRAVKSFSELEPGDVISVDYEENKILGVTVPYRIDHTFIVIRITPDGDAICAANDDPYNDRSMRAVAEKYANYRVLFWNWHIDSNYIAPPESEPPALIPPPPPNEGGGPPDFPDISPDNNGGDGDDNGDQNDGEDNNDYQGGPPDFPDIPPDNPGGNDNGGNNQTDRTPPVIERENSRVEFLY